MDDANEKSCVHYPLYLLLILKYIYANHLLSDSVGFTSNIHPEKKDMQEVNVSIWFSNDQI